MMKLLITVVFVTLGVLTFARPPNPGNKLIKSYETDPGIWLYNEGISNLIKQNIKFIDITNRLVNPVVISAETLGLSKIPSEIRYEKVIRHLISKIQQNRMKSFVTHLSSYRNRHYNSKTGKESALWILSQIQNHIATTKYSGKASVNAYEHTWLQPSIIARIEGQDENLKKEVVILGAHLDSISESGGVAPGADDNASGCSVLFETFKILLESNFLPQRTIEFQFYAAEEVGLRGSGDIADNYTSEGVQIASMINFDSVGYFSGRREIGIHTDGTNLELTQFLRALVDRFLNFKWADRVCGYACSDYASWAQYGYRVAYLAEYESHPDVHTANDTVDTVNFEQVHEFAKIAVGCTIELSQPL